MADIVVNTYTLRQYANRLDAVNRRIVNLDKRLDLLYNKVGLLGLFNLIQADILTGYSYRLSRCQNYLNQTASDFDGVERILTGMDPLGSASGAKRGQIGTNNTSDNKSKTIISGIAAAAAGAAGTTASDDTTDKEHSAFAKFVNNELKTSGAVLSGETSGEGEFLGFSTAGSASGSILYGEAGIKSKMSWKYKDKDGNWDFKSFGLSTEAKATGAVAKGEVEGNIGYLHGKLEGSALTGAVSGEVKATLWDDGKFNPSLFLGGKAEGSVLKGSAEGGFGTDQYGIYGKADGDLLHAEAEAKAGVGYIGKDKNGKAQYGASAEASAMASLAQGKVKGGISLFGIDIDVGLKGYAGAAGVEVGGSITTSGVKANLSGALALGAGLDVSIDWSDATWIGDTVDAVGDFVGETADFVSDVGQSMWNGITSTADSVGDFLFGWL